MYDVNYTYGRAFQPTFYSFRKPFVRTETTFDNTGGNASGNVRHVVVGNWLYDLPFGRGKKFAAHANGFWDRVIGGWSFQGVARLQTGRLLDFGNVRLIGMTPDDLRAEYKVRLTTDPQNRFRTLVFNLPQDIIDNTVKAFNVDARGYTQGAPSGRYFAPANSPACIETVTGFGDCGVRSLIVTGPKVSRVDFNFVKRIRVTEKIYIEGQAQVFNVFNTQNFNPVDYAGSVPDSFQITGAIDQSRTMQLAFRISF
jgi:hypothetical protein